MVFANLLLQLADVMLCSHCTVVLIVTYFAPKRIVKVVIRYDSNYGTVSAVTTKATNSNQFAKLFNTKPISRNFIRDRQT